MANNSRLEQIRKFLEQSPDDPFLRYAMAIEFIGMGQDGDARGILELLRSQQPDYHATYYHLAKLYERIGLRPEAIACYEEGLECTKRLGEDFAWRELRSAYDELLYD